MATSGDFTLAIDKPEHCSVGAHPRRVPNWWPASCTTRVRSGRPSANDRRMWASHAGFLVEEVVRVVPAPVLAEAWRGGARQASLVRLLAMCVVEAMTEGQAREVGVLAGKAKHADIVDVTAVESAARRGAGIVSSDPEHIRRIAAATRARVRIERI